MKILITGSAGFIGFHLAKYFAGLGHDVTGIDNLNAYYDMELKHARLKELGVDGTDTEYGREIVSGKYPGYSFIRLDITDKPALIELFDDLGPVMVFHLAAQAGVRYSISNPDEYISNNITGFFNLLEACRRHPVKRLFYASSSSVYGNSPDRPYSTSDRADAPVSLYAATKRSNELMAHAYSHLYAIPVTGLRFFTVYGPWGRPDMAPFIFTKSIIEGAPIKVFNGGDMYRDFTYVDDVVKCLSLLADRRSDAGCELYNIGGGRSVRLMDFISAIEKNVGREAVKEFMPMQKGDVLSTLADTSGLEREIAYSPEISVETGVARFVNWYRDFYDI